MDVQAITQIAETPTSYLLLAMCIFQFYMNRKFGRIYDLCAKLEKAIELVQKDVEHIESNMERRANNG